MNKGIANGVLRRAVDLIASALKVPPLAVKMFRLADELSGLNRETIPRELIPLNAMQLSRGLLNYAALQSLPGWIFPYWAERQFDPSDPGFIPRSHLGLSVNVTRRNWTAVGTPNCAQEPVVDPRGAVMPFRNRWSLDVWMRTREAVFYPSRQKNVSQRLLEGLPIVETTYMPEGFRVVETAFVDGTRLFVNVAVENLAPEPAEIKIAFAVRPFNPEGLAVVHDMEYTPERRSFVIDQSEYVHFSEAPDTVCCSNREGGDSAEVFAGNGPLSGDRSSRCDVGLASAFASFTVSLGRGESRLLSTFIPLDKNAPATCTLDDSQTARVSKVATEWKELLCRGGEIVTPDEGANLLLRSALCTLLLLSDENEITPGPWTYHQFWFRDAAVMLRSLDAYGFREQTGRVIGTFASRQDRDGYFRSQQGEWDSTGQALWTIWQNAILNGDKALAVRLFDSMKKGVEWIKANRISASRTVGKPYHGLMPAGLSAEHLGLCDYYFYDNWWSAAGIQAFVRIARWLGKNDEADSAETLLVEYRLTIARAVEHVQREKGLKEIPAGPLRGIDSGMIGSCAAWYPLQELPPSDERMCETLTALGGRFTWKGLFFQDFVHSGGNAYLSLQIAQAWLYGGSRKKFWQMFSTVADSASSTLNYPEAIHPQTGGGSMGDGHHGWAAAEVAMSLRNAVIQEYWKTGTAAPDLVLLGGIPPAWCLPKKRLAANRLPVPGGIMSLDLSSSEQGSVLDISCEEKDGSAAENWTVKMPVIAHCVTVDGLPATSWKVGDGETVVVVKKKAGQTKIVFEKKENGG